ncbi:molybdenum cofactor sulfurase 3 [Aphis craccivora]|uniref:Molybdenum cofactor sulfurase 3 n=1 Tax=Aphis craccivora TaxID=307492 RepID=A0A6G0W0D0_APHCR|nr:molybdenum cofactor sulfurase 3 [Aphis craccivora]
MAVGHGLDTLCALAGLLRAVACRTFGLAAYLYDRMSGTRHGNGSPVFRVYADTEYRCESTQGGVVNFNVLRDNGKYVGYNEVSIRKRREMSGDCSATPICRFSFLYCAKKQIAVKKKNDISSPRVRNRIIIVVDSVN